MRKLFISCLLSISCCGAQVADAPTEFRQAFVRYEQRGTLLQVPTFLEVRANNWGPFYRDAVAERFKGSPIAGLSLEVSPTKTYTAKVGEKFAFDFRLSNGSDKAVPVVASGSCHTVHQATLIALDPQGQIVQNVGMIKAGGPHCWCNETKSTLAAKSSVQLDTHTDSEGVIAFAPTIPGKYVIVGQYALPDNLEQSIYSAPIVIEVK